MNREGNDLYEVAVDINHEPWLSWYNNDEWEKKLHEIVELTLDRVHWKHPCEISILLTDYEYIRQLNKTYRGQDKPTNVLSFPAFSPQELALLSRQQPSIILGDIVLSLETVLEESQEQEKRFLNHLMHLVVHGTLHLLGYDHLDKLQAEKMESLEIDILCNLGVANPYQ